MTTKTYIRHYLLSDICVFLVIGAFIALPSLVLAQDEDENGSAIHDRILNHFDHDGDGTLNDREKHQARKYYARHKNSLDRPDRRRPDVDRPDRKRPDVDRPDRKRPQVDRTDRKRPEIDRTDRRRPRLDRTDRRRPDVRRHDVRRHDVRQARRIQARRAR